MARSVVDASAVSAVLFKEPEEAQIADRLRHRTLIAPSILPYEVANVCLTKMRRDPDGADRYRAGWALIERLNIRIMDVDHAAVVDLARFWKLTAYDASYLWLADRSGAELVTLDRRLAAADAGLRARRLC